MGIRVVSHQEKCRLGPVALDQAALMEIGKAVSTAGKLSCKARDAHGVWYELSSPEDFVELSKVATPELKYVSLCAVSSDARKPVLSVELSRDRASLSHSTDSPVVLQAVQQVLGVCRPRTRKWTSYMLEHPLVGRASEVLLAAGASLLISAIAGVKPGWWLASAVLVATTVLVPTCRFVLRRVIRHAYIHNSCEQDHPRFFRRNKDAILVSLMGAAAVTVLALLARLL